MSRSSEVGVFSKELTPKSNANRIGYERRWFLGLARILRRRPKRRLLCSGNSKPAGAYCSNIVPTSSLYEVFKRVLQQRNETEALRAVALMQQGEVVHLDMTIALSAAKLSVKLMLPMADSIMLATAREYHARLWTQDTDFMDVDGVRYFAKKSG